MQIAIAHSNTDFDSLASQFAVTKLYPDTRMAPGNPQAANIREFLALYRDSLPIVDLQYVEESSIDHIFIVDCQHLERIDDVARKLITERKCPYTVFDHHVPDPEGLLPGATDDSQIQSAGSCTTLLVKKMMDRQITLTAFEATLLAIGVYEDSGCLTYAGTTALDAQCVAYLLQHGADLGQVSSFINPKLDEAQTELFQELINGVQTYTVSGAKVAVAAATRTTYIDGLSTLTRRLLEVVAVDAAVSVVFMRDRVHIVGRSDSAAIDMRNVVAPFGGGGHHGAASAVAKNVPLDEVTRRVASLLQSEVKPELTASQIMRSPVRTIKPETTMEECARLMMRYDEDGLVVIEENAPVGVVSKRDIDKALHHKLGHAPVKGFMSRPVITTSPETGLSAIQQMMVEKDIGRLPILSSDGRVMGIVTRRDLLRTLFGVEADGAGPLRTNIEKRRVHLPTLLQKLDDQNDWLFKTVGMMAAKEQMAAYAVGGVVRDLLMGADNFDLDFVIEGSAIRLAELLEKTFPGRLEIVRTHERFQTATLYFYGAQRREVDLSTARTEFYEHPAALPTVEASVLEQDLFRRDFTINALAVCLNPDQYGDALDFFDGIHDIEEKLIRVLHKFSFIEDPTRIIRAARFAARLEFHLEESTYQQAERAIAMGVFDNLGGFRLKEELKLILESRRRSQALDLLNQLGGGLRYLAADLAFDAPVRSAMRRAERLLVRHPLSNEWIVYLAAMVASLSSAALEAVMERLYLGNDEREWIRSGLTLVRQLDSIATDPGGSSSRSAIYATLHGLSEHALAIAASVAAPGSLARRWIKLYLDELRQVRVFLSGNDLLKIGFAQGPHIRVALDSLRDAKLDGRIHTPAQELEFIKSNYPQYFQ